MALSPNLISKYNYPAPRYTSYPTVPLWENNLKAEEWEELVKQSFKLYGKSEGITLYIHLPFCESLCTYCGCNKRITKNHSVEQPYIEALLKEWKKYLKLFSEKPKLAGIHLGGGTPTFFAPASLHYLLNTLISDSEVLEDAEFSFEGHPNNTTLDHLKTLSSLGFDRVSYGIQDFDPDVQVAIHRTQPFEAVKTATENARNCGFKSINFDLIYGLPHQTIETLSATFEKVTELRPDRIAFYSYAHVPSSFPAQKSYETYLPNELEKRSLYEFGKKKLLLMGYEEIGMDHFAQPSDPLFKAKREGTLHRNFMGYTTSPSKILIGLGASSISDIHLGYAQNEKSIHTYQELLEQDHWPLVKGHVQSRDDLQVKELILDLICKQEAEIPQEIWGKLNKTQFLTLQEMELEGLFERNQNNIRLTEDGVALVRTVCMQFDLRLAENQSKKVTFSKAI
ncbi:oxygen-independent coproporphyrinogen III oxidase [Algoriphagus sp. CAU 1675]|uniref:oxygen-independent coproporphyrinogen III oxidase n=1 Tax=Algoriphagus sp. CAU 1675 TaxID=3032597 RepID=UPI0023DC8984|nr:oxygen-independent coproporphyrinogen III oxidase [Algoriphagus sp. CAU 1675]MDF2158628.1 oxygen-independent coproporphyrinogen III oxidase [Algoriphagus sp. CAU 1675]